MFGKNKLFAAVLFTASGGAAAFAQETTPAPGVPPQRIERQLQIFTNDDGNGYLGVQMQEISKENFAKFGLREVRGVAVEKVLENSPAAQAGFQTGDVIVKFDGEEVTGTRKLQRLIGEVAPDHQARITVSRGGSERELTATIGKRPAPAFQQTALGQLYGLPGIPEYPNREMTPQIQLFPPDRMAFPPENYQEFLMLRNGRQIGVGAAVLTKQLSDYFGVAGGKGILINNVTENSPAAKAGLKAGDVITEADGKAIATILDLTRAVNSKTEGDVVLTIVRNRAQQTVRVTPEKRASGSTTEMDNFFLRNNNSNRQLRPLQTPQQNNSTPRLERRTAPRVM